MTTSILNTSHLPIKLSLDRLSLTLIQLETVHVLVALCNKWAMSLRTDKGTCSLCPESKPVLRFRIAAADSESYWSKEDVVCKSTKVTHSTSIGQHYGHSMSVQLAILCVSLHSDGR